ncbi:MAG: PHB depolymerase family esterase [Cellvibrionaceae bacterium]
MKNWKSTCKQVISTAALCSFSTLMASQALADANNFTQKDFSTISGGQTITLKDTYVYTPQNSSTEKRALMVVLHGCDQPNTELADYGNLEAAADEFNAVIAVPHVAVPWPSNNTCWPFDGGNTTAAQQNTDVLVAMANELVGDSSYDIDEARVYITGLSSGGGMSLIAACSAPDVFTGVDAVAGPSVGTNQSGSIYSNITPTVADAAALCLELANGKSFAKQIAHVGWGERDFNGTNNTSSSESGTTALVSVNFSHVNVDVWKEIYSADTSSGDVNITQFGGSNITQNSYHDSEGKTRVTSLSMYNVGHAWPAGDPTETVSNQWIAQFDINYPRYILNWFETNSVPPNSPPEIILDGLNPAYHIVNTTWAEPGFTANDEEDGDLTSNVQVSGSVNTGVIGDYQITYTVTDSGNKTTTVTRDVYVRAATFNPPPVITLNGPANETINLGDSWTDSAGPTAYDAQFDGDLTAEIQESGSVNTSQAGSYTITYSVSDYGTQLNGATGTPASDSATRTITVVDQPSCWTTPLSEHVSAGRAETAGGYQCLTVGGGDQLPDLSYTCDYIITYGGDTTYSITETAPGVFNKAESCDIVDNIDSDSDGVFDQFDLCPNTPAGTSVDSEGCPIVNNDSDNDGVTDDIDQCPNTPPGDTVNAIGCTVIIIIENDEDGDGVTDDIDACPGTPAGTEVDVNGCPIPVTNCLVEESSNYNHKIASPQRAYSVGFWAPQYYAVGSDEALAGSTYGNTILYSEDDGSTWSTTPCLPD